MEEDEELPPKPVFSLPSPSIWLSNFITLQADILSTCLIAFSSPFISILSLFSDSFRPEKTKQNVESAVQAAAGVPSKVVHGGGLLLKKIAIGFLAAVYVFVILTVILAVAFVIGIGLVKIWVEKPVILREGLHFDYTKVDPVADFKFGNDYGGFEGQGSHWQYLTGGNKKVGGVPIGHTFYVSLVLLVPESDYNREIGVFQLTAEIISSNGQIMEKATHPCMLQFRSWPIRIVRTFIMGIPLLLGLTAETQTIKVPMLKHKEDSKRSSAIRIILSPRAGTDFLPQLYEAEILLNSQLPWWKEVVRRWKWTLYVWTSMYIYIILVLLVLSLFRPLILPDLSRGFGERAQRTTAERAATEETETKTREESDVSESLRRWHRSRSKRKAMLLQRDIGDDSQVMQEPAGGSSAATSMSMSMSLDEESGDSESVCYTG